MLCFARSGLEPKVLTEKQTMMWLNASAFSKCMESSWHFQWCMCRCVHACTSVWVCYGSSLFLSDLLRVSSLLQQSMSQWVVHLSFSLFFPLGIFNVTNMKQMQASLHTQPLMSKPNPTQTHTHVKHVWDYKGETLWLSSMTPVRFETF